MAEDARNFTDADLEKLASCLIIPVAAEIRRQMVEELQLDVGRTVLVWAKRAVVVVLVFIAMWGAAHFGTEAGVGVPLERHQ